MATTPKRALPTPLDSPSSPQSPPPKKAKSSLRVLCFGDSITLGHSPASSAAHPYSEALRSTLATAFPALDIDIHVDGGLGASASNLLSLTERIFLARGGGNPYDWTVVLGGTNDLINGQGDASDLFAALRRLWAMPLGKGGRVLACTIPEDGSSKRSRSAAVRGEVNALIKGWRQENLYVCWTHTHSPSPIFANGL